MTDHDAEGREVVEPETLFGINPDTYWMWKAYSGNAKARRRWRRRLIPNRQRQEALART